MWQFFLGVLLFSTYFVNAYDENYALESDEDFENNDDRYADYDADYDDGEISFAHTIGTYVTPTVVTQSGSYGNKVSANILDNDYNTYWNSGHISGWRVPNWVVLDFHFPVSVVQFELKSIGDTTHDPKIFDLQISCSPNGPWISTGSKTARAGTSAAQKFSVQGTARYWRFYITKRYTIYQAYVRGIRFLGYRTKTCC